MKTYVFDIDGTICSNTRGDYESAKPHMSRIHKINSLYDQGAQIIFLTARGMGSNANNIQIAKNKWEELTKEQLREWGVKYHLLFMGKPAGDLYIDDKGTKDTDFFNDLIH